MFERMQQWLDPVPEPILGLLVLGIAAAFVWATLVDWRMERRTADPPALSEESCHEHHAVSAAKGGHHHDH
jgi:hypothetical protein